MRVLIVEDDAAARRGLTELVRAWGYEADNAADGQEGLEKVTTLPAVRGSCRHGHAAHGRALTCCANSRIGCPDLTFVLIHGSRQRGHGGLGHEGRGLRLPGQAVEPAASSYAALACGRA